MLCCGWTWLTDMKNTWRMSERGGVSILYMDLDAEMRLHVCHVCGFGQRNAATTPISAGPVRGKAVYGLTLLRLFGSLGQMERFDFWKKVLARA